MADSSSLFEAVRRDLQATVDVIKRDKIYMAGLTSDDDCEITQTVDKRDQCFTTVLMLLNLYSRDTLLEILFNYD